MSARFVCAAVPPGEWLDVQSLWMLASGASFALMSVFVKLAAETHSAAELVFWRSLVQMAVAWLMLVHAGSTVRTSRFGMHAHRGVAGFVALFMFFHALTNLPIATAMTLSYSSPIFLAVLLAILARERPKPKLIATVVVGFAGVVLLLQPAFAADQVGAGLVGLAAGAVASVAFWNVRELSRAGEPDARILFYFGFYALLGSLVWMAPQTWHAPTTASAWLIAGLSATGALGQWTLTRAYGHGSMLVSASLSYSGIVFSALIGIVMFDDRLPLAAWAGIALIVAAGVAAVQLRPTRREDAAAHIVND